MVLVKSLIEFTELRIIEIEMSMMGELKLFLIFQMKQLKERMFISQAKYVQDILKKFNMDKVKIAKIPTPTNGDLDLQEGL